MAYSSFADGRNSSHCKRCGSKIKWFDDKVNKSWLPINTDGSSHKCPLKFKTYTREEIKKLEEEINSRSKRGNYDYTSKFKYNYK